jgi:hypothetical protein
MSDPSQSATISVEVAYALPEAQFLVRVQLPPQATVRVAIERSGLLCRFPEIDLEKSRVGVFGRPCAADTVLADGDRVEIYRPLLADAKERRRLRADGVRRGRKV